MSGAPLTDQKAIRNRPAPADRAAKDLASYNMPLSVEGLEQVLDQGGPFRFYSDIHNRSGSLLTPIVNCVRDWIEKVSQDEAALDTGSSYRGFLLRRVVAAVEEVLKKSEIVGKPRHPSPQYFGREVAVIASQEGTQDAKRDLTLLSELLQNVRSDGIKGKVKRELFPACITQMKQIYSQLDSKIEQNGGTIDNATLARAYMLSAAIRYSERAVKFGSAGSLSIAIRILERIGRSHLFEVYERPIENSSVSIHEYYRQHNRVASASIPGVGPVTSAALETILAPSGWADLNVRIEKVASVLKSLK